jgi:hypothetical protein
MNGHSSGLTKGGAVNVHCSRGQYNRSTQTNKRTLPVLVCSLALVLGASIGWSQPLPHAILPPDTLPGIGNPVLLAADGFASTNSMAAGPVVRWDKSYDGHGNPLPGGPQFVVGLDSLYFKQYGILDTLYGCPKSEAPDPTPGACRTAFAFLDSQTRVGMSTPAGNYIYEVNDTTLRRHSTTSGAHTDYAISSGSTCCMTDGQYLYVPVADTVFKYTFTGTLVTQTTLDITPLQYRFSLANDTIWCSANAADTVLNGYACSKFSGGSITPDATWIIGPGTGSGVMVAWGGQYYYAGWNGDSTNTFRRFNPDRSLSASGTIGMDTRGVMCRVLQPLMIVTSNDSSSHVTALAETLKVASGGVLGAIGNFSVEYGRLPATAWYNAGCRVIFIYIGPGLPGDQDALGDSLARFVDLGGRVVTAMWTDSPYSMGGRFLDEYMPFTTQTQPFSAGTMSTVHDPLHPIMDGVKDLSVVNYISGNDHYSLRSPNCVCLAQWDVYNYSVVAYLDSANVRLVSLGFVPTTYSDPMGDWSRLLVNTILWVWPGTPAVSVSAPDTASVWDVGTSHDITWTADSGPIVRDSIVYSCDSGVTWSFLGKYNGSRNSYAWDSIPNTPSTGCYVKVFAWNAAGSARGLSGRFEIRLPSGITQPEHDALPLASALCQPYPNPLSSGVAIRYALPRPAPVDLRIYDVAGTLVRRLVGGVQSAGFRHAYWNGRDGRGRRVAPGVYYCRFRAGDFTAVQKLVARR